jgi:hypothetical protein
LAITQTGDAAAKLFAASGAFLLWGLVVALVCGGMAWINFTVAMMFYANSIQAALKGKTVDRSGPLFWIVAITVWGTPALAIVSLVLFVLAAQA